MPERKKKAAGKPGPKRKPAQKSRGEERVPEPGSSTPEASKWAAKQKAKPRVTNGKDAGNPMKTPAVAQPHEEKPARKIARPSTPRCGAMNRQGNPCGNAAGFKTDHPGVGRCKNHGGSTPAPTGRYSSIARPRVQELLKKFEADPDPLNLLPEVQVLRALLHDYIDRFDQQDQMLTRWNLSFEKGFQSDWNEWWRTVRAEAIESQDDLSDTLLAQMPDPMDFLPSKPLRMADITEVASLINQVGVQVERIRKAREGKTFDMGTVDRLWTAMSAHLTQALLEVIEDDELRSRLHTAVAEKWATISLAELASRRADQGATEG